MRDERLERWSMRAEFVSCAEESVGRTHGKEATANWLVGTEAEHVMWGKGYSRCKARDAG